MGEECLHEPSSMFSLSDRTNISTIKKTPHQDEGRAQAGRKASLAIPCF